MDNTLSRSQRFWGKWSSDVMRWMRNWKYVLLGIEAEVIATEFLSVPGYYRVRSGFRELMYESSF